jgi:6-phosphogluconolactonase (cycloisomerase 2 family)
MRVTPEMPFVSTLSSAVRRGARHALAAGVALLAAAGAAGATPGALIQLPDLDACVSDDGSGGDCVNGRALQTPTGLVVTPDNRHVYVAATGSDAIAAFRRNSFTGALTQLADPDGCVSDTGTSGNCIAGRALVGPVAVAVSPDGRHVYATSQASKAVTAFVRNKLAGTLTPIAGPTGCVRLAAGDDCAVGIALDRPYAVVVSPDGRHVYVASENSYAVAAFSRNKTTGGLTQLAGEAACISEGGTGGCASGHALREARALAISKDGKHVYVASEASNAVAVLVRNKTTGALTQLAGQDGCVSDTGSSGSCVDGEALVQPVWVALSNNGKHLYVASLGSDAVAVFRRNSFTGALTQLAGQDGCVSAGGGACATGVGLGGARAVVVSRDGKNVYVAAQNDDAVAVFTRDRTTGALTQLADPEDCISQGGGACAPGVGLGGARAVGITRNGKHIYVGSFGSDAVAAFERD